MRILVIESENADVNEIIDMYVTSGSENEIIVISNDLELVSKTIEESSPDVILVDSGISNSFEDFEDTPLIYITGLNDDEIIIKANKYNPKTYLVKPFDKEMLFATIDNAVRLSRLEKLIPKSLKDE